MEKKNDPSFEVLNQLAFQLKDVKSVPLAFMHHRVIIDKSKSDLNFAKIYNSQTCSSS